MRFRFALAMGCLALALCAPARAELAYVVDARQAAQGTLAVSLDLPPDRALPEHLVARALARVGPAQIADVRCDGLPLERDAQGWRLPSGCREAAWTVSLVRAREIQASEQRSVWLDGGWGFFTEPSAILRPDGWSDAGSLRIVEPASPDRRVALSREGEAPGFYVIGNPPVARSRRGDLALAYLGDRLADVTAQVDPGAHLAGLGYLRRVIGARHLQAARELTVVWLPVTRSAATISGSAGRDAVFVNYIPSDDHPTADESLFALTVVLHEQFHQLVAAHLPVWASESLAQYYALAALAQAAADGQAVDRVQQRFFGFGPQGPGLRAIQQQVLAGDASSYGLFYLKGASFWSGVDAAIRLGTHDTRSLDDFLPALLDEGFRANGQMSGEVFAALPSTTREEIGELAERYL